MKPIILASKSKRRLKLLQGLGLPVKIVTKDVTEEFSMGLDIEDIVMGLAGRKVRAIAKEYEEEDCFLIAADTLVWYDGVVLGKPEDESEAFKMLTMLSDNWHKVYTGIAVMKQNKLILDYEVTRVKFRSLSMEEIEAYLATAEPMDKAGSYGIQELGGLFVEKIEGDYYNVVGLPLCKFAQILQENFATNIFSLRK